MTPRVGAVAQGLFGVIYLLLEMLHTSRDGAVGHTRGWAVYHSRAVAAAVR